MKKDFECLGNEAGAWRGQFLLIIVIRVMFCLPVQLVIIAVL